MLLLSSDCLLAILTSSVSADWAWQGCEKDGSRDGVPAAVSTDASTNAPTHVPGAGQALGGGVGHDQKWEQIAFDDTPQIVRRVACISKGDV